MGSEALEAELAAAQKETSELRTRVSETRTELIALEREHRARTERQAAIAAERERWTTRSAGAEQQIATLQHASAEAEAELEKLAGAAGAGRTAAPEADERARRAPSARARPPPTRWPPLTVRIARRRRRCARRRPRLPTSARHAPAPSSGWKRARTPREEARKIREQLACAPEDCLAVAGLAPARRCPPLRDADSQLARLKADRERLGGVNLQADEELTEP